MVIRDAPARRVARCLAAACMLATVFGLTAPARSAASGYPPDNPIGVHSMLYVNDPLGAKQAMFEQAAAIGASEIRLDIALENVFPTPDGPPDWSGVDQYMTLARQYRLRVLADLLTTPSYMAGCPAGTPFDQTYRCAPTDPVLWGRDAGLIAAHTRGVIDDFEIVNEADGGWAFLGSPQQYGEMLAASYESIHRADPGARVALGGLMNIGRGGREWMNAVLASLGPDPASHFDIANIHVRTTPAQARAAVARWRRYFVAKHFTGPLWVTETGYPADPAQQTDPSYRGGPAAQARYLSAVIPAMLGAGAAKVFVTERDALSGRYASEGVLDSDDPLTADPQFTRRPSFYAVQRLGRCIELLSGRRKPSRHSEAMRYETPQFRNCATFELRH
jgi:hypothetical protein